MFEEAQLYSPVTHGEHGDVTVHLSEDDPGAGDPEYRARRNEIAALALALEPGAPAYGAGILSSDGEIDEFRGMEHRPIDLVEMGTADYDITRYQPVLYRAESLDEVREVVGGFFASCTDESIAELRARAVAAAA